MYTMELESFIQKFNLLWKNGHDAYLNVHSNAGNSWVGISLNLGSFPGPSGNRYAHRKNASPARTRRREKRAAVSADTENKSNGGVQPDEVAGATDTDLDTEKDLVSNDIENSESDVIAVTQINAEKAFAGSDVGNGNDSLDSNNKPDDEQASEDFQNVHDMNVNMVDRNYSEENNGITGALLTDSNDCTDEVSDNSKIVLKENYQNVEVIQTQVKPDIVNMEQLLLKICLLSMWPRKNLIL